MRYMLVIYGKNEDWSTRPAEEIDPVLAAHESFGTDLRKAGAFVAAEALQPSSTATTIRLKDGQPLITDGPFLETKEQIGGFYLIEVDNLDAALEWGNRLARIEENPISVWPVFET
jgi:hypothetical protein